MDCVCSPDRAKLCLNSVLKAIAATVKGVSLWGQAHGSGVTQPTFADDWAGVAGNATDVKAMAAIWNGWVVTVGAKLGVKLFMKTVVTGVVRTAAGVAS